MKFTSLFLHANQGRSGIADEFPAPYIGVTRTLRLFVCLPFRLLRSQYQACVLFGTWFTAYMYELRVGRLALLD